MFSLYKEVIVFPLNLNEISFFIKAFVILFTSHKGDVSPPPPGVTIVLKLVRFIQITLNSF